jgi:hypothetical protein
VPFQFDLKTAKYSERSVFAMRRLVAMSALCASLATVSFATVLNFENLVGSTIPLDYGNRVDASGTDTGGRTGFDLTFGATPNVQVLMFSADYQGGTWNNLGSLYRWDTGYANLTNVAYHFPSNQGARFIFTADASWWVRLHSFQMGGWPNTDRTLPFLQVLVNGNPLYTWYNLTISGSTATTFSFDPNVVQGTVIEIRFGGDWNVGIDNIGISQIPEPASLTLLVAGLAGLGLRRRPRTAR